MYYALSLSIFTGSMIANYAKLSCARLLHARTTRYNIFFAKPSKRLFATNFSKMKRKATESSKSPKAKRAREPLPDYCDVVPQRDEQGSIVWPAPAEAIDKARGFIREWYGYGKLFWIQSELILLTKRCLECEDTYCARQRRRRP